MNRFHSSHWALAAVLIFAESSSARITQRHLQPVPANPDSIESQLKRFKGQTQFLNPQGGGGYYPAARASNAAALEDKSANSAGGARRDQQESDVFKVGKKGSKLLYLLNDSRGLQTVSFAAGVTAPQLLGRVAATGNYSDQMYYDAARDRLVVLERLYFDESGNYNYSASQSRAIVYDVSNPENPRIAQELALDGEIADSRMVGDVLYVATSVRPDYTDRYSEQKAKGLVYSVALTGAKLSVIKRTELALPTSARENMNIVEIEESGSFRYYLVAVLSESAWGWWDRQSLVEVVDISDPKGDIKPLMVVSAKGTINERSQTSIKNNTLIVVSNFRLDAKDAKMQIAVETFKLPTAQSEIVDENEALFRKLNIERQLKDKSGKDRDAAYQQLVRDPQVGLQDRFVRTAAGQLRKVVADSALFAQDDKGQHASLQDVRFADDLLYVFWVPQNQVDPFDLFDISQPEKGVKYVDRLEFPGWIQRSIPVRYQGRNFVLALGQIVPPVTTDPNERRRYPQAMLFEVVGNGASAMHNKIAQITLDQGNLWTDFNGRDKNVEVRFTSGSTGSLMFEVYGQVGKQWVNGGKVIHFNLDAAIKGDRASVFREGSLLVADSNWLKRVFTNPEIDRINSFSNTSLATFDGNGEGKADAITKAVSILELARDIQAYVDLPAGNYARAAQIVSASFSEKGETEVRLVDAKHADAEKSEVAGVAKLEGRYVGHVLDGNTLLVSTQEYRSKGEGNNRTYENITRVYRLTFASGKVAAAPAQEIVEENQYRGYFGNSSGSEFVKLGNGEVYYRTGSAIYRMGAKATAKIAVTGCETETRKIREFVNLNGSLYISSAETLKDPAKENVQYSRNWLAPVQISGQSAQCGAAINIPGKAISLTGDGHLVTEDERFVDYRKRVYRSKDDDGNEVKQASYSVQTESAIESLKVAGGKASLIDDYELGTGSTAKMQPLGGDRLGYFVSEAVQTYGGPYRRGSYYSSNPSTFVSVGFANDWTFTREVFVMPEEFLSGATFAGMIVQGSQDVIGIVTSGRKVQVVRWSGPSMRPEIQNVRALDVRFQKQAASATAVLPQGYWNWRGSSLRISYNPVLKSLQIPQNEAGVVQLYLE